MGEPVGRGSEPRSKIVKAEVTTKTIRSEAAVWTPWGWQKPAERNAQRAAIRRMIRKLDNLRRSGVATKSS